MADQSIAEYQELFENQGYMILENFFDQETIEEAQQGVQRLVDQVVGQLEAEGKLDDAYENESYGTRLYKLYQEHPDTVPEHFRTEMHIKEFFDVLFNDDVLDVVEALIGSEIRLNPGHTIRCKYPETGEVDVPWHQDAGFYQNPEEIEMVNLWSPLVPARKENGCMEFIPGTNDLGYVQHTDHDHFTQIAPELLEQHADDAVPIELDPGDIVVFDFLLFHRGRPNHSDGIRWNIDWRYQDPAEPSGLSYDKEGFIARSENNHSGKITSADEWSNLSLKGVDDSA